METATQQSTPLTGLAPEAAPLVRMPEVMSAIPPVQTPAATAAALSDESFAMSDEVDQLLAGLAKAQLEFDAIERNKRAEVRPKDQSKAAYSYAYADLGEVLSVVRPKLAENGIAMMQFPDVRGNGVRMTTFLAHTSGQFIRHRFLLPARMEGIQPQDVGGLISFARRYVLQPLLGVAAEDHDANAVGTAKIIDAPSNRVVQMPQRSSAQVPVASPLPVAPVGPAPAAAAECARIKRLDKRLSKANKPYWVVELTDGRQAYADERFGRKLEDWFSVKADIVTFETTTKGNYTWIDEAVARPHGEGHR